MTRRKVIGMRIFGALAACVIGTAQMATAQEPATELTQERVRVIHAAGADAAAGAVGAEDTFVFISNAAPIMPFGGRVDIIAGMGTVPGSVVTGKPYSADADTKSTQMLADGNRITQRNETRIYRDGQGRTRCERTLGGLGVWETANEPATTITIHDPVAGTSYMLDPRARTAHAIPPFKLAAAMHAPGDTEPGTTVPVAVPVSFELPLPPPVAGVTAFPPVGAMPLAPFGPVELTTEDLGEQILEGVLARGSRETRTIPAGAIGNERPINIVMERWYSDELEADVLRRNIDPRFGETTYQLVNVVLGEPSADLFVVPESYDLRPFEFKLQRPEGGNGAAP